MAPPATVGRAAVRTRDRALSRERLWLGARFLCRLPKFLRHPLRADESLVILRRRLANREQDFLALVRSAVFEHPRSPYRPLLAHAGCEYGDLERLVREGGVAGALRALFQQGVYLTVQEFKGREPVIRGSLSTRIHAAELRNSGASLHVPARSGGSRGEPTPAYIDLAFIRERAVDTGLVHHARGGQGWRNAIWKVPGGVAMVRVLEFSAIGAPPLHWFSPIDAAASGLRPRYGWISRAMRAAGLLAGVSLPLPRYVPLDDPAPIARWMAEERRRGFTPHLHTTPSAAVRLCQAAREAGLDLDGAEFTLASEATTAARLAAVRSTGAGAQPCYAVAECGPIAYGCLAPESADDMHLLDDLHAVIQPMMAGLTSRLPHDALLISSLRSTAPFIPLNVSMGDQAVISQRRCGCPLAARGWSTHVAGVRSHEKLTAGGMTFLDTDVMRVLDEILPARFGGLPTHYQLVEDEAEDGQPRLRLLVHPAVGPVDGEAIADSFLQAVGAESLANRLMGLLWREAKVLRIERRAPMVTAAGKILHLHAVRSCVAAPD